MPRLAPAWCALPLALLLLCLTLPLVVASSEPVELVDHVRALLTVAMGSWGYAWFTVPEDAWVDLSISLAPHGWAADMDLYVARGASYPNFTWAEWASTSPVAVERVHISPALPGTYRIGAFCGYNGKTPMGSPRGELLVETAPHDGPRPTPAPASTPAPVPAPTSAPVPAEAQSTLGAVPDSGASAPSGLGLELGLGLGALCALLLLAAACAYRKRRHDLREHAHEDKDEEDEAEDESEGDGEGEGEAGDVELSSSARADSKAAAHAARARQQYERVLDVKVTTDPCTPGQEHMEHEHEQDEEHDPDDEKHALPVNARLPIKLKRLQPFPVRAAKGTFANF